MNIEKTESPIPGSIYQISDEIHNLTSRLESKDDILDKKLTLLRGAQPEAISGSVDKKQTPIGVIGSLQDVLVRMGRLDRNLTNHVSEIETLLG